MTQDFKLLHATDFTNEELPTLKAWLTAVTKGDLTAADRILSAGLLAEHYNSLLPDNPADQTVDEQQTLSSLKAEAAAARAGYGGYP